MLTREFKRRLPSEYIQNAQDKGLSLHDAVTLASLIQKEAANHEEMRKISEVIHNRIQKRIPLGIDAALIYGIKDYKGNIRTRHLKDRGNPYNTRIHRGLPPSPICSPSVDALQAALEPTKKGYLYFVLLPGLDDARHHFSTTLKEHNRFVRRLVKAQREQRARGMSGHHKRHKESSK